MKVTSRRSLILGAGASIIVPKSADAMYKAARRTFVSPASTGVATDAAATAWKNQVVTNGGTVSAARLALVSAMIAGLKTDGVWTLLDRLFIFGAENEQSALTSLVNPSLIITKTGTPTFTTDRGYTPSAGNYVKDTVYSFASGTNYLLNSGHLMVYVNNSGGVSTNCDIADNNNAGGFVCMQTNFTGNLMNAQINTSSTGTSANSGATGSFIGSRTGSSLHSNYQNGTLLGSPNTGQQSIGAATIQFNQSGNNTNRLGAASVGGGLTAAQVSGNGRTTGLDGRILTYLTAIGGN